VRRAFPYSRHSGALGPRSPPSSSEAVSRLYGSGGASNPTTASSSLWDSGTFSIIGKSTIPSLGTACCPRKPQQSRFVIFVVRRDQSSVVRLLKNLKVCLSSEPTTTFSSRGGTTAVFLLNLMLTRFPVPSIAVSECASEAQRFFVYTGRGQKSYRT
jgi:hypothetical protein